MKAFEYGALYEQEDFVKRIAENNDYRTRWGGGRQGLLTLCVKLR